MAIATKAETARFQITILLLLSFLGVWVSCEERESSRDTLFEKLSTTQTGIEFRNDLTYTKELNPYTYRNFFNGGGVAVGDINNDGLVDIYFTGNQVQNRLYLNKGDFEFEDITEKAGVAVTGVWSTGATMVDIDGDGLLDIYVTKSGSPGGERRHNELFINNGDLTFDEKSNEYGLDVTGLATDAIFFDYDRDGDLDMYLLNNSFDALQGIDIKKGLREVYDEKGGDRLYRNDRTTADTEGVSGESTGSGIASRFVEVTREAGIYSSKIGFGLDVAVSDINSDGWLDIYISNDFFERDYLYLNKGDGTFSEVLPEAMPSISQSSMGADVADINNDGRPEIFVTDMLPESDERVKSKTVFDSWSEHRLKIEQGYHHQFVRNTLQLNNGSSLLTNSDNPGIPTFSEISRMAGVDATDWSWTTLIADFQNDGHNDIYVTNGILKDLTDLDYVNDRMNLEKLRAVVEEGKPISILFDKMPSTPLDNYVFAGTDSLFFTDKSSEWGLTDRGFSNGAAYADLNNDGALDLIVNHANRPASVYRNRSVDKEPENNWLMLKLEGNSPNTSAIGASVTLWSGTRKYFREQMPGRGFQSSVDHRLHIGLGRSGMIDSVMVQWTDGSTTLRRGIATNQILRLNQSDAKFSGKIDSGRKKVENGPYLFRNISDEVTLDYTHRENDFLDFNRDKLLFHSNSSEGPPVCTADINNDGLDDFYIGGAKDQPGAIFIQHPGLKFTKTGESTFIEDEGSEDTACAWIDVSGDGLLDLYVGSGGSEFPASSTKMADRLYLNMGDNKWVKAEHRLPISTYSPTSVVKPADINGDGLMDLFTGERLRPFAYGLPVNGNMLVNKGDGTFENVTEEWAPDLLEIGMIRDAEWFDYDNDDDLDLIVVGEWMPVRIFENISSEVGKIAFREVTTEIGLSDTEGLWNSITVTDLDGDGYKDIIAGNIGLNTRLKAAKDRPLQMWVNDFDRNGSIDQVIAYAKGQQFYPLALRDDMFSQIPSLAAEFPGYSSYAGKSVGQIFSEEDLETSLLKKVRTLQSMILWNNGSQGFSLENLNQFAQVSPVFGVQSLEGRNGDHFLLLGGNLFGVKPEIGRYDASYGTVYRISGDRNLRHLPADETGFELRGEVRGIHLLKSQTDTLILIARNNNKPLWYLKN